MRKHAQWLSNLPRNHKGMDKARQVGVRAECREKVRVEENYECKERPNSLPAPKVPSTGHGTY